MGLSEQELDAQCDELFGARPIEFVPRKGSDLDCEIAKIVLEQNIRIPILHIKDSLYLIGHKRLPASIKRGEVMLRVGGGYEKFSEHLPHNARYYERALAVHMLKSGESLETVVDLLFHGKKVPNLIQQEMQQQEREARLSRSRSFGRKTPSRSPRHSDATPQKQGTGLVSP